MTGKFDIFELLIGKPEERDYLKKPVIIQGITGNFGSAHTRLMKAYGTNVVGGITPGKGGQDFEGIPVTTLSRKPAIMWRQKYQECLFPPRSF